MITDGVEAVTCHHRTGRFVRKAAPRDDERILPRVELDELPDSGLLDITVPARFITEAALTEKQRQEAVVAPCEGARSAARRQHGPGPSGQEQKA